MRDGREACKWWQRGVPCAVSQDPVEEVYTYLGSFDSKCRL